MGDLQLVPPVVADQGEPVGADCDGARRRSEQSDRRSRSSKKQTGSGSPPPQHEPNVARVTNLFKQAGKTRTGPARPPGGLLVGVQPGELPKTPHTGSFVV